MDKRTNVTEFKNEDFYFLYVEKLSEKGMTNRAWHMHSFYEIMFFPEGNSEYVIDNNRYVIKKGDVLLIKPGEHHFERTVIESAIAVYCLGFDSDRIKCGSLAEKIFESHEHIPLGTDHPIAEILSATKKILKMFIAEKKTFALEYKGKVIGSLGIEEYDEEALPEFAEKTEEK